MVVVGVWHGSIAEADVDVLVNASNTMLWLGTGVSGAIAQACGGSVYQRSLDARLAGASAAGLEPGEVVVTDAGTHPRAQWVAHVAVMDYRKRDGIIARPDLPRLERAAKNLWSALAELPGSVSVGMVALGAGTGGMGLRQSVEVSCRALRQQIDHGAGSIASVTFVSYEQLDFINTIATVRQHFPINLEDFDEPTRRLVEVVG